MTDFQNSFFCWELVSISIISKSGCAIAHPAHPVPPALLYNHILIFSKTGKLIGMIHSILCFSKFFKPQVSKSISCIHHRTFALALNEEYLSPDQEHLSLSSGDTLAVIPPISGGWFYDSVKNKQNQKNKQKQTKTKKSNKSNKNEQNKQKIAI